ncbi:MBL fold metallo-hydrolase [Streptomyces sp. NPDC021098]|uniref:MBL fold metallo-hydrolase n=1 Tax=unclassified Streptomyces TaxID=2593676 RepID=UPI0037AEBE81
MRLAVLGGCGAWPTADQACSGYLVDHAGFRLLIDPGYATLPRLLRHGTVDAVDAVLISHGHPDHCADLNPLLRARGLSDDPPPPLPVHAPHGAVDAVLALDKPRMLANAYRLHEFTPGDRFDIGPYTVDTWLAGHYAHQAGAARLMLTHLWPGTAPAAAREAAAETFAHPIAIAAPGVVTHL